MSNGQRAVTETVPERDGQGAAPEIDGRVSWLRLLVALALCTVGGAGMWTVVVVLPAVQAEFGVDRAAASLPYALLMLGIAGGGMVFGRLSDRHGIVPASLCGAVLLGLGFLTAATSPNLVCFALAHGLLVGIGCSASFGPLMADISFWFARRRGIAVAIVASGNYLAGAFWPPLVQHLVETSGWRTALAAVGVTALVTMVPLALTLRWRATRPRALRETVATRPGGAATLASAGLSPGLAQGLLVAAGISCCVAMSMPQVHIVAYCGDLGYGPARGAEMLALMLAFGIISRVASGFVADRIGGLMTLLVGSALQCAALVLYMFFDGLASLYVVSALFGLFQGGIVPSYAMIVRDLFPPAEAGRRVGLCVAATLVGMALGGWMSGVIFDRTGSYLPAFANGIAWNVVNQAIALFLIWRVMRRSSAPPRIATVAA